MKIAIYTDNPPISEAFLAFGMSRANTRLFRAINNDIAIIVATYEHRYFTLDEIDEGLHSKIVCLNISKILSKIIKKITVKIENFFSINLDLSFYLFLPKIIKTIKDSHSDCLFVPLGADIREYIRALKVAEKTELSLVVYMVDDFKNYAILSKNKNTMKLCDKYINAYLQKTSKIFVISTGMKERMIHEYGVDSIVLNLPYEKECYVGSSSRNNDIFFLGNASHFYHDGLRDMVEVICDYNERNNTDICMRFTISELPNIFEKKHMQYIKYGKIDNECDLSKEISEAMFCFIPSSFDVKYKVMVSTSFPSKLMECLAFAKEIVIYGPKYSSSVRYFEENKLQTSLTSRNQKKLYELLNKMTNCKTDKSKDYVQVIKKNHNFEYVKSILLGSICEI